MNLFFKQISLSIALLSLSINFHTYGVIEKSLASDFQIYQLLSAAKKNPQFDLPSELIETIVINAYKITERLRCYEEYGSCLSDSNVMRNFMKNNLNKVMDDMSMIHILQTCLSCSGKSLGDIKNSLDQTIFHTLFHQTNNTIRLNCVKTICLVAGNKAWNIISMEDSFGNTVLHWANDSATVHELLRAAPSPEKIWELVCKPDMFGLSALHNMVISPSNASAIKALLACAPSHKEVWGLINDEILSRAAEHGGREIVEILEFYRPV